MSDHWLFVVCGLLLVFIGCWQLLAWLYAPRRMARDLVGRSPTLRLRPLTYREREYLAACNKDGFRFAIVSEDDL